MQAQLISGQTFHGRKGAVANSFRYSVDYLLVDTDHVAGPALFGHNRRALMALHDGDYGDQGRGVAWARQVMAESGIEPERILLLAQPRLLGHVFNPVAFWLAYRGDDLMAVLAEVTNTYGDRHSYLCLNPDGAPILPDQTLVAAKVFHVSPFQPIAGEYRFRFDIRPERLGVWIDFTHAGGGVFTNLIGPIAPLTNRAIIWSALRRPFASRRVLALIHWQALKLFLRGVPFLNRTTPPAEKVTR